MCIVSNVFDTWIQQPNVLPWTSTTYIPPSVTKKEFEDLKREIQELKELIKAARKVDDFLGAPDCEDSEKAEVIRRIADWLGVDLSEIFE